MIVKMIGKIFITGVILVLANSALAVTRTGTIGDESGDEFVLISGIQVSIAEGGVVVIYKDAELDVSDLSPGLRVRYETDRDGNVERITILGTTRALEALLVH